MLKICIIISIILLFIWFCLSVIEKILITKGRIKKREKTKTELKKEKDARKRELERKLSDVYDVSTRE